MKTGKNKKEGLSRSVSFDVFLPEEHKDKYQAILNSIRLYRYSARQMFSAMAMCEMAKADPVIKEGKLDIAPNKEFGLFVHALGKNPERAVFKSETMPTAKSFVDDSLRRDVESRWKAPDPEFVNAKRGWLCLQGARAMAKFNHIGIGMPYATAKPKLHEHKITVKWDHEIGTIDFVLGRLDGGRYYIWKCLRDGEPGWSIGTMYLNEKDGKLRITLSYHCPEKKIVLDSKSVMVVGVTDDPENFICMTGEKLFSADKISFAEADNWLRENNHRREYFERCRAAVGIGDKGRCPKVGKKHWKAIQVRVSNNTRNRELGVTDRNHLWTRRIINNAVRNNCGVIRLLGVPEREIFGHPWNWSQFRSFLEYKADETGIKLEIVASADKSAA